MRADACGEVNSGFSLRLLTAFPGISPARPSPRLAEADVKNVPF
jgi:hypothetical protein